MSTSSPVQMLRVVVFSVLSIYTFGMSLSREWVKFKVSYNKEYGAAEEVMRRNIFYVNYEYIEKHNREDHSYTLGVNEFADMTNKEFVQMMNGYSMRKSIQVYDAWQPAEIKFSLPTHVDWRKIGYVTEVKNQGKCGSCWAFSATGSLEGQHYKKTGKLVSLSEQNLVDCSWLEGNRGCHGGRMNFAFNYIKDNKGIDTEASYCYTAKEEICHFNRTNTGATDIGYVDIVPNSETALHHAVAKVGPISVAIDASHPSFQFYKSGVYMEPKCSSTVLDHGVLAVGYGTFQDQDYWLVKNSWGTSWGQKGYVMMARNKSNMCGIATQASFPLV